MHDDLTLRRMYVTLYPLTIRIGRTVNFILLVDELM